MYKKEAWDVKQEQSLHNPKNGTEYWAALKKFTPRTKNDKVSPGDWFQHFSKVFTTGTQIIEPIPDPPHDQSIVQHDIILDAEMNQFEVQLARNKLKKRKSARH